MVVVVGRADGRCSCWDSFMVTRTGLVQGYLRCDLAYVVQWVPTPGG